MTWSAHTALGREPRPQYFISSPREAQEAGLLNTHSQTLRLEGFTTIPKPRWGRGPGHSRPLRTGSLQNPGGSQKMSKPREREAASAHWLQCVTMLRVYNKCAETPRLIYQEH